MRELLAVSLVWDAVAWCAVLLLPFAFPAMIAALVAERRARK